jgi:hypothetical protein
MGHFTSKMIRSDHFWNNFSRTLKLELPGKSQGSLPLFQCGAHAARCRLQFNHFLPRQIKRPVSRLAQEFTAEREKIRKMATQIV